MTSNERDPEKTPPSLEEAVELLRTARIELQAAMLAETLEEDRTVKRPAADVAAGKGRMPDPWPH